MGSATTRRCLGQFTRHITVDKLTFASLAWSEKLSPMHITYGGVGTGHRSFDEISSGRLRRLYTHTFRTVAEFDVRCSPSKLPVSIGTLDPIRLATSIVLTSPKCSFPASSWNRMRFRHGTSVVIAGANCNLVARLAIVEKTLSWEVDNRMVTPTSSVILACNS